MGEGQGRRYLLAPAKLNIGLRVGERGADGYHRVRTLLCLVELADELWAEPAAGGSSLVEVLSPRRGGSHFALPAGDDNLVMGAVAALRKRTGAASLTLRLGLLKRIPTAAGLGGGSSDAAAALRLATAVAPVAPDLVRGAAEALGADVPFFLGPSPAVAEGRGDRLSPVAQEVPGPHVVLAKPPIAVATAWAYAELDRLREGAGGGGTSALTPGDPAARLGSTAEGGRGWHVTNDLETTVVRRHPEVSELAESLLGLGALGVGMTGSGPTVYGLFASRAKAVSVARGLRRLASPGLWIAVTALRAGTPAKITVAPSLHWGVAKR